MTKGMMLQTLIDLTCEFYVTLLFSPEVTACHECWAFF